MIVHGYEPGDVSTVPIWLEKLAGVVRVLGEKLSQKHPVPSDAVTLTPLLGLVLVTETFSAGGWLPPMW